MRAHAGPAADPGRYEIRLLGPFTVLRAGARLADHQIGSRKARTLFKRLLVQRDAVVSADALAETVWPQRPPEQPARHIATLVSRLRAALGSDVVVRVGEGYRFGGGPAYAVDVDGVERLVGEAEARLAAGQPALAHSAAGHALDLLGAGDLLADEPYADWAAPARVAAGGLLRRARRCAWAAALEVRELDVAVRVAEAALAAEPFNEEACRALMRAHHGRGEPGLALAAYERLRAAVAEELGTDPTAQTRALHLAILRGEREHRGAAPPSPGARAVPDAGPGAIVGRDAELAGLHQAWSRACAGAGGLVLLVGEAGIGKTVLAAEVARLAAATGGAVAQTRCYRAERSLFLQPVADALRPVVVSSSPDLVRAAAGRFAGSLAEVIAEVGAIAPTGGYRRAGPEVERRRVYEALVHFVQELAGRRPLLLFLDDLHQAGASTLEFLHFLLRRAVRHPVLVLATARIEEGTEVIEKLGELAQRYDIGPLGEDAVRELARRSGRAGFAARIMARTRGHSLFVVETLRALADAPVGAGGAGGAGGAVDAGGAGGAVDAGGAGDALVPDSLRAAVQARVRRAGPPVEELLRAAAILGGSFDPALVAGLMGAPVEEVARRAEAAGRARLLIEAGAAYEFANDLIQEIVYQTTPLPTRIARHRRAAELLAANPEAVAAHAGRAGDWPTAMEACLRAADTAARRYANRDAERLLDEALQAAVRADDPDGIARARLARGRIREALTDYPGAYEDHSAVVDLARSRRRPDLELAALRQLGGDALVGLRRPIRECVGYLDPALTIAEAIGDLPGQIDILGRLAVIWTNRLRFDLAGACAQRAVDLAETGSGVGDAALCAALDATKTTLAYRGDMVGLEALLPRLRACLGRAGNPQLEAWAEFESAFPALAGARWAPAAARIEAALRASRESGYVAYQAPFQAHLAWVERARGRYGEAVRLGRRAAELAAGTEHPWWVALAETMLGWTLTELGATDEAAVRLRRGLAAADRDATEGYQLRCLGHLAWAMSLSGDPDGGGPLLERAEALLRGVTGGVFLHGAHAGLAVVEARVARGELRAAERLLGPIRRAAAQAGWVETVAWADLLHARSRADTDPAHAVRLAGGVLELAGANELPGLTWQAHALLALLAGPAGCAGHAAAARDIVAGLAASLDDPRLRGSYRAAAQRRLTAGR